jgi:hypothetical protein
VPTTAGTDPAENPEVLDWLVDYVTERHAKDSAGVPRGQAEQAYHEAHGGKGRNRARQVIDWQLALAADDDLGLSGEINGESPIRLARGSGEMKHGVYLYPASHALSPLSPPLRRGAAQGWREPPWLVLGCAPSRAAAAGEQQAVTGAHGTPLPPRRPGRTTFPF